MGGRHSQRNAVRLGLMPPITGIVGLYGPDISWAGTIATQIVNEEGGVLGRPVELILKDDGSIPETAVPAAEALIDEHHCVAVIGNLLSNSRIAVASQVTAPRRVPYLNFSFYEGSISEPYFYSFSALPNQQIDKMIPYMARTFGVKMFFAGHDYEWPRGSVDAAKRALLAVDGEVLGEEYLPMGSDFGSLLNRLARSGADVFVPYFAGSDQQELLKRFTEMNLKNHMQVVMGHYDEAMVAGLSPEVREGLFSSNTYFMSLATKENTHYLERLSRMPGVTGIWPEGNGVLTNFGEGTYLCVKAWARAVNLAGTLDSEAVAEALRHVEVDGPQGRVVMDPESRHATVNAYLSRCKADGTFEIIQSFGRIAPVLPKRYSEKATHLEQERQRDDWQFLGALRASPGDALAPALASALSDETRLRVHTWLASKERSPLLVLSEGDKDILAVSSLFCCDSSALLGRGFFDIDARCAPLLESGSIACMFVSDKGLVIHVDEMAASLLGYASAEVCVGRHVAGFWSRDVDWQVVAKTSQQVGLWVADARALHVDGTPISCRIAVKPLVHPDGHVLGHYLAICPSEQRDAAASLLERVQESTDTIIMTVEPTTGLIVDANRAACQSLGFTRDELIGLSSEVPFSPVFRRSHRELLRSFTSAASQIATSRTREAAGYRKDGTEFVVQCSVSTISVAGQGRLLVTMGNVDQLRRDSRREEWARQHDPLTRLPNADLIQDRVNNALLRSKTTRLQVGVLFVALPNLSHHYRNLEERDSILLALSERLPQLVGAGDTVGRSGETEFSVVCDRVRDPEHVYQLANRLTQALRRPLMIHDRAETVTASITVVLGRGSTLEALRAVGHDLHASSERYRALFESSPHGIVECDLDGVITLGNPAFLRIHGFSNEDCIGHGLWTMVADPIEADRLRIKVQEWRETPEESLYFVRHRTTGGESIDVRVDWDYRRDETGEAIGYVYVITDVTLQVRAERELVQLNQTLESRVQERTGELGHLNVQLVAQIAERREIENALRVSEERFRGVFEQAADGILLSDPDGRVLEANPAFGLIMGYSHRELLGMNLSDFGLPGHDQTLKEALDDGTEDTELSEHQLRTKDGDTIWVRLSHGVLLDSNDEFLFGFVLVHDITKAKAIEEQRRLMTRELDHRVKNNLAGIVALLQQTARATSNQNDLVETLSGRLDAMARVHEMLARNAWKEIDLAEIVSTTVAQFVVEEEQVTFGGPDILLPSSVAVPLGMALYEVSMNAAKHGALSHQAGSLQVQWSLDDAQENVQLDWNEQVASPLGHHKPGLGMRIIHGLVGHEIGGHAECRATSKGLRWEFSIPVDKPTAKVKSPADRAEA